MVSSFLKFLEKVRQASGFSKDIKTLHLILDAVSRGILSPQRLLSRSLFEVKHWWRKLKCVKGICVCVSPFP